MNVFKWIQSILLWIVILTPCLAQELEFDNPIAEQRADPWVHKTEKGTYYFIAGSIYKEAL